MLILNPQNNIYMRQDTPNMSNESTIYITPISKLVEYIIPISLMFTILSNLIHSIKFEFHF